MPIDQHIIDSYYLLATQPLALGLLLVFCRFQTSLFRFQELNLMNKNELVLYRASQPVILFRTQIKISRNNLNLAMTKAIENKTLGRPSNEKKARSSGSVVSLVSQVCWLFQLIRIADQVSWLGQVVRLAGWFRQLVKGLVQLANSGGKVGCLAYLASIGGQFDGLFC